MATSAGPAPVGGDQTRAPTIIGVYSVMTSLSIICVAARLYTRFRLTRNPGMDDAVIVLSMVCITSTYLQLLGPVDTFSVSSSSVSFWSVTTPSLAQEDTHFISRRKRFYTQPDGIISPPPLASLVSLSPNWL